MVLAHHRQGDGEGILIAEACGPFAWAVLHHVAESFPCAPCADEGASLMRFAHDLVNHNLDKPVKHPDDLKRWSDVVLDAGAAAGLFAVRDGPAPPRDPLPDHLATAIADQGLWQTHMGQDTGERAEVLEQIEALRARLSDEPANTLVRYIKRSGRNKGQIVDFTPRQFREISGKVINPELVNEKGNIPWELALDELAQSLGYSSDDALRNAIEQSLKDRKEIERLERDLAFTPAPTCSGIESSEVPCLEWDREFCKQKEIRCNGTVITAVRSPIDWSIHITTDEEFPDTSNELDIARRANDAARTLLQLAEDPTERILQGQLVDPQGDGRLRVNWCNLTDDEIDAAWNFRPLFKAIVLARGLGSPVEVCRIGFETGTLQVTVGTFRLDSDVGLAVQINKLLGRAGTQIAQPFGSQQLIFQVVLPGAEPNELAFEPQEVIGTPARPGGTQAPLFQGAVQCEGDAAERFERCVLDVKQPPHVNPFAVCTASVGCSAPNLD